MSDYVDVPPGGAILLDELGAQAIRTKPAGELALVVDLGGRLNKRDERRKDRYLMRPEQAAELVANIVVAGQLVADFGREFEQALTREQERVRANLEEHGG